MLEILKMDDSHSQTNHHKDQFHPEPHYENDFIFAHNSHKSSSVHDRQLNFSTTAAPTISQSDTCDQPAEFLLNSSSLLDINSIYSALAPALGSNEQEYFVLVFDYLSGKLLKCEFDHFMSMLLPAGSSKSFLYI